MKLESKETGNGTILTSDKIYGYHNSTDYVNILNSFFIKGIQYRGLVKIGELHSFDDSIIDPKIGLKQDDFESKYFKIEINIPTQTTGTIILKANNIDGDVDLLTYTIADDKVEVHRTDLIDFISNEIVDGVVVLIIRLFNEYYNLNLSPIFFEFPDNTDLFLIKQYYSHTLDEQTPVYLVDNSNEKPILDSSDFLSFLYYAKKGILLRNGNKIFNHKDLVDEKYDLVEFSLKVGGNKVFTKYKDLNDFLTNCIPGDIFIFNYGDVYQSMFIIDPIKRLYTECSGWVEFYMTEYQNGTINPFNFENRFLQLFENSILYHIRLK